MRKILLFLLTISSVMVTAATLDASATPPNNLAVNNVPQLLVMGFDDNLDAGGLQWMLDFIENLKNPEGTGNKETYDGTPVRCSFYDNTRNGFDSLPDDLVVQHKRAFTMGNEIGDHTAHHWHTATDTANGLFIDAPAENWASEISLAKEDLISKGVCESKDIVAFRTPFLEYNNALFQVLKDSGFVYDCSIEEGGQYLNDENQDGTNYFYPYTLDKGSPGHNGGWTNDPDNPDHFEVTPVPGLWELPNHLIVVPPDSLCEHYGVASGFRARVANNIVGGDSTADKEYYDDLKSNGKITGFDYNLWTSHTENGAELDSMEFLAILKYTLDLRLQGNRAPFMMGAHTQFYTAKADAEEDFPKSKYMARRWAIESFITYALSKPEVRMVPGIKVINWMENPTGLDGSNGTAIKLNKSNVVVNNSLKIGQINSENLNLISSKSGIYTINITSLNGKSILMINNRNIQKGTNTINLGKNTIKQGIYIVSISGDNISQSFKITL